MSMFDNIRFPYFNLQQLNLDWLLNEVKRIAGFMPQDGNVGDILTRKSDGAAWEQPAAVQVDINGLPADTQIMDNDELIFYDVSAQANRKIKPPDLLDSMSSNAYPSMDGTASAGTSKKPARYDHVHPTDTSRAKASYFSSDHLKVANGGTGAGNASDARTNLGLGDVATESVVPIAKGGTGQTTAFTARQALEAAAALDLNSGNRIPIASNNSALRLTFSANWRGLLVMFSATSSKNGLYVITAGSSAALAAPVLAVSDVTITASANTLTLQNTANSSVFAALIGYYDLARITEEVISTP